MRINGKDIEADIIIDASGHRSLTVQRLSKYGFKPDGSKKEPPIINLTYATRLYRIPNVDFAKVRWRKYKHGVCTYLSSYVI